jgi:undecaprenyl-diphosphatase
MELLLELDRNLFLTLNSLFHPALDEFMLAATDAKFWIPFYLWFIFILFKKLERQAWLALICIALTVLMADQISSHLLKPLIARLRPSHDPAMTGIVNLVKSSSGTLYRGGLFGFPSSHAANSFGVALFLWLVLAPVYRWAFIGFGVAFVLSYTRIYLGVHYPADIFAGMFIGFMSALASQALFVRLNRMLLKRMNLQEAEIQSDLSS